MYRKNVSAEQSADISIFMYVDETKYLQEALNSICKQKGIKNVSIQVVLLDAVCSEDSKRLCQSFKSIKKNITLIYTPCENTSKESAYNQALNSKQAIGRYVQFTTSSASLSDKALKNVASHLNEHSVLSLQPVYFDKEGDLQNNLLLLKQDREVEFSEREQHPNIYLPSYFFKSDLLENLFFSEAYLLSSYNEIDFILSVFQNIKSYFLLSDNILSYTALEQDAYNYADQYVSQWYIPGIDQFMMPVLKKYSNSRITQMFIYYIIQIQFACNMNDRHKSIMSPEEIELYLEKVFQVLQYIDDDILLQSRVKGKRKRWLPKFMGYTFFRYKHKNNSAKIIADQYGNIEALKQNPKQTQAYLVDSLEISKCLVSAINYDGENLIFDIEISNLYFSDNERLKVCAVFNNKTEKVTPTQIYSLTKFYGVSVHSGHTFHYSVPISRFTGNDSLYFQTEFGGYTFIPKLMFKKTQARLFNQYSQTFWMIDKGLMLKLKDKATFVIQKITPSMHLKQEIKFWLNSARTDHLSAHAIKGLILRGAYWLTKPYFSKKEIWVTFDQLFKCGDNGEYFYRYVSQRKDKGNIKIYYIANKTAPEFSGLKKRYKTMLKFNSLKHKVVSLHASKIFATRVGVRLYCGIHSQHEHYVRDLFNAEIYCLQHGLTIQRIAQYQNRLFDNTKLYFCVSPYEVENIKKPVYGYSESMLKMTGAPRFDGLVNNDKRYILISPTWRRNVTSGTNQKGDQHTYSPNFKNTRYFKIYNELINDKHLIESAKNNNYRIMYLLHPILSAQIEDFEKNEYVDIFAGADGGINYEKVLTEASLMLTDHSGIQFDFAYMRKPLVYYHPSALPPQYDAGGLEYNTMGFGPVCDNHKRVVQELCKLMDQNCQMDTFYKERVDNFFAFDDRNNCERVFNAAREATGSTKKNTG